MEIRYREEFGNTMPKRRLTVFSFFVIITVIFGGTWNNVVLIVNTILNIPNGFHRIRSGFFFFYVLCNTIIEIVILFVCAYFTWWFYKFEFRLSATFSHSIAYPVYNCYVRSRLLVYPICLATTEWILRIRHGEKIKFPRRVIWFMNK